MAIKRYPRHLLNIPPGAWKEVFDSKRPRIYNGVDDIEVFERSFAKYIGTPRAFAVSSGRTALFLALKALGLRDGEEVMLSAYNFPIVPLMIKKCGFVPVFVDADSETYNVDIDSVEANITSRTRAVIATHLFGQPCDIERLKTIAVKRNIALIEDCAHSCGAEYKGQKVGSFGDAACFSFSLPKNITCFGGGMVVTKKTEVADNISSILSASRRLAKRKTINVAMKAYLIYFLLSPKIFPLLSYPVLRILDFLNFNLTERTLSEELKIYSGRDIEKDISGLNSIQARVGLLQLDKIEEINNKLIDNANFIAGQLGNLDRIRLPRSMPSSKGIFSYYRVLVDNPDRLKRSLLKKGIDSQRGNIVDCSMLRFLADAQNNKYPNAKMLYDRGLEIPSNCFMGEDDLFTICNILRQALGEG